MHGRLSVREATPDDAVGIWRWRNDPASRAASGNSDPIPLVEHIKWFSTVLDDPERDIRIVTATGGRSDGSAQAIGSVRFDRQPQDAGGWLVSLNLPPEYRGRGLGRDVLLAASASFFKKHGPQTLLADIRPENIASLRVFVALEFEATGHAGGDGLERYRRPAKPLPETGNIRGPE